MNIDPEAMRLILLPLALIHIAISVVEGALAMRHVVLPVAQVFGAIIPLLNPVALAIESAPLPPVNGSVLELILVPSLKVRIIDKLGLVVFEREVLLALPSGLVVLPKVEVLGAESVTRSEASLLADVLPIFEIGPPRVIRLQSVAQHVVSLIVAVVGISPVEHVELVGRVNRSDNAHLLGPFHLVLLHVGYLRVTVHNHFLPTTFQLLASRFN